MASQPSAAQAPGLVHLRVGPQLFVARREVLASRPGFFGAMFSPGVWAEDGAEEVYIDR